MSRDACQCLLVLTLAFASASTTAQPEQPLNAPSTTQPDAATPRSCDLMLLSPASQQLAMRESFLSVLSESTACIAKQDAQCAEQVLAQVDPTSLTSNERALLASQRAEVANSRGDSARALEQFQEAMNIPGIDSAAKEITAQRYASALLSQGEFATALRVLAATFACDTWTANALVLRAAAYQRIFVFGLAKDSVDAAIRLYELSGGAVPAAVATMRQQLVEELAKPPRPPALAGWSSHSDMVPVLRKNPDYPPRALQRGVAGCVKLELSVTEDGEVENARVIESSDKLFDQASLAAVQAWRYAPRLVDDLPVRVDGIQTKITFELEGAVRARAPAACEVDVAIGR